MHQPVFLNRQLLLFLTWRQRLKSSWLPWQPVLPFAKYASIPSDSFNWFELQWDKAVVEFQAHTWRARCPRYLFMYYFYTADGLEPKYVPVSIKGLIWAVRPKNSIMKRTLFSFSEKDPCSSEPCRNGGDCIKITNLEYACHCAVGWTGDDCNEGEKFILCTMIAWQLLAR